MTGVVLGIITALLWGSADILSSLAARYVGAWRVTLLAQVSGCLALAEEACSSPGGSPRSTSLQHFHLPCSERLFYMPLCLEHWRQEAMFHCIAAWRRGRWPWSVPSSQPTEQSRCWQPSCSPASRSIWKKALCWRSSC